MGDDPERDRAVPDPTSTPERGAALDPGLSKRALRAEIRKRRESLDAAQRKAASAGLTRSLISLIPPLRPATVACYLSTASEPDTRPFVAWAAQNGVRLLLPISREDGRLDWVDGQGDLEVPGLFGIGERVGENLPTDALSSVDMLLVPAAAVDRSGMRMGWGRGYFDRTMASLAHRPTILAVVYDEDVYDVVPREPHDLPVDGAVTPSGVTYFSPQ